MEIKLDRKTRHMCFVFYFGGGGGGVVGRGEESNSSLDNLKKASPAACGVILKCHAGQ